jgi:hypothetical protein
MCVLSLDTDLKHGTLLRMDITQFNILRLGDTDIAYTQFSILHLGDIDTNGAILHRRRELKYTSPLHPIPNPRGHGVGCGMCSNSSTTP